MIERKTIDLEKAIYEDKINKCSKDLAEYEKTYESLLDFKRRVINAQEVLSVGNGVRNKALNDVYSIRKELRLADIYYVGMKKSISTVGSKIVNSVLGILIEKIDKEMDRYKRKIDSTENELLEYESKLNN